MKAWDKFKLRVFGVDSDTFIAYRTAIPSAINLQIDTIGDSFVATIKSVNNEDLPKDILLVTEAQSQDELVDMVNDLIFSYKNIPEEYRPYYKRTLQPEGTISGAENLRLVKAG